MTAMRDDGHMDDYQRLADRLSSEYAIIQDKIDKIGAFRFTIRGWTVTLVTGVILTVATTKLFSAYAPLFLLLMLYIFSAIERQQNRNQEILEDRAFEIEVEWRRSHAVYGGGERAKVVSPWIAHTLRDRSATGVNAVKRFIDNPDRWFYWALGLIVCVAVGLLVYLGPQVASGRQEVNINVNNEQGHVSGNPQPTPDTKRKATR
jgi:hypothetical protein